MYTKTLCQICGRECDSIRAYIRHYQIHKHDRNVRFPCCVSGCRKTCFSYKGLISHIERHHQLIKGESDNSYRDAGVFFQCSLDFCRHQCSDVQELLAHLRSHISSGLTVSCPFEDCSKTFTNKKSFSSHLSRYHRNYSAHNVNQALVMDDQSNDFNLADYSGDDGRSNELEDIVGSDDDGDSGLSVADYTKCIALFLLKLHSKFLVPESTIQMIVEEMHDLYKLSHESAKKHVQCILQRACANSPIPVNVLADDILDGIAELSCGLAPVNYLNSPLCGALRSKRCRYVYYKNEFEFVKPVEIKLGVDSFGKTHVFHYVPILETLKVMWKDGSVQTHIVQASSVAQTYNDVHDGKVYKQNAFYKDNPNALQILLFQDSFEVVNPLGSARGKHKILAVYYTLGNIDARCRSVIDPMQLVLLCKEKSIKYFGQEAVFSRLVQDIKFLEEKGICVNQEVVKGTILAIVGDNLGSHFIGGFCESFNSEYYCRYCLRTKDKINEEPPYKEGVYRTIDTHKNSVQLVEDLDVESDRGVKCDSVFNGLSYFHVANPGLPPCLGHDLFEGVVDHDMALYIQHFVACEWFTYETLNELLQNFPFHGSDGKDRLYSVRKGEKIGGQAVQNWHFLRFFPLIIYNHIPDPEDPVWELLLKLKQIVELIVSPTLASSQVAYLKVLVDEYLEGRHRLFPAKKLRPKHHFLSHYAWLTLMFGPLIRVWTLRFENKHSFFKKCVRFSQNFKNVTAMLSERHQLLQAFCFHGRLFPEDVKMDKGTTFHPSLYAGSIQQAIHSHFGDKLHDQNCEVSDEVCVFGTKYTKDMYVLIKSANAWSFGCILLVLLRDQVYFLVRQWESTCLHEYGVYQLHKDEESSVECVPYSSLMDYFPLSAYSVRGKTLITLKNLPKSC